MQIPATLSFLMQKAAALFLSFSSSCHSGSKPGDSAGGLAFFGHHSLTRDTCSSPRKLRRYGTPASKYGVDSFKRQIRTENHCRLGRETNFGSQAARGRQSLLAALSFLFRFRRGDLLPGRGVPEVQKAVPVQHSNRVAIGRESRSMEERTLARQSEHFLPAFGFPQL